MDKNTIGSNAGMVWRLLSDQRRWTYNDLKQSTGLSDYALCAAIGWLARENKIAFEHFENAMEKNVYYLPFNIYI